MPQGTRSTLERIFLLVLVTVSGATVLSLEVLGTRVLCPRG